MDFCAMSFLSFQQTCLIDERRILLCGITYIYLFTYVYTLFCWGQRPSDARCSFVVCAHVKIRQRNISLFVAFTRPDDSVAVPRHEAFISKYVYRCVQGPGSSLNKCRSIYKGSKMRMFLLSLPLSTLSLSHPASLSSSLSLALSFCIPLAMENTRWSPTVKNFDKLWRSRRMKRIFLLYMVFIFFFPLWRTALCKLAGSRVTVNLI